MSAAFEHRDLSLAASPEVEHAERQPVVEGDDPQLGLERMLLPDRPIDRDDERKMHFGSDDPWDVFIPDDDELDPLPEPGDFWIEPDE